MHEILSERAAELTRLAATIRSGLEEAESTIPAINDQLNQLAMLGITSHQVEGPSIYARPAGLSNDRDDEVCVFQAVLLMPGGIGAAVWKSEEFNEHALCGFGEQTDLRDKFLPYAKLLPVVRAMLVKHADHMVSNLLRDVRRIDS
jgi:hypothetical protein